MRILILGGTGFIDPFQVEYALSRGRLIELCSTGPARILSLQDRGTSAPARART